MLIVFRFFPSIYKVPVWAVLDYTETNVIQRELLLVKVSILGSEYLDEQLEGGPSHDPRRADSSKLEREAALAENFERGASQQQQQQQNTVLHHEIAPTITASEALRLKHQHLHSLSILSKEFGAKILDIAENSVIVELTAKTPRVEAFLSLLKPFGILESARTGKFDSSIADIKDVQSDFFFLGLMAMPRTPIVRSDGDEEVLADQGGVVDASLLPPG